MTSLAAGLAGRPFGRALQREDVEAALPAWFSTPFMVEHRDAHNPAVWHVASDEANGVGTARTLYRGIGS